MPLTISKSVAQLLKEETCDAHAKAEFLLTPKLSSIKSRDDYAAVLKMFYGYFHPLEKLIANHITIEVLNDADERRNSFFILHDLKTLGHSTESIALCEKMPAIKNVAGAFGSLYVLEGSTLGGRMISKMLLKNVDIGLDESNLNFFNGYKDETGRKWAYFLSVINQFEENAETIVAAANETFEGLTKWMEKTI